jgi:hypothetical protein
MRILAGTEIIICMAFILAALTLVAEYTAPAGSQRTGQGDPCYCGGRFNIDPPDGKTFTCSHCGRTVPNVVE